MHFEEQPIYLHVGDQTTGAEDLVVYLAANRAGLRRAGYGLYCFDVQPAGADPLADLMPSPLTDAANDAQTAALLAQRFAPDRKAGGEGFILSAPELAGSMGELLLGLFHSQARARARHLRRALGQGVRRLVLAVQPYETLFHSTWMMLALERRIDPMSDYAPLLAQFRGGWADLGQALVEELEVEELVIQAAPAMPPEMLARIVPGLSLRQPTRPLPKPRVTPSAVFMAQRCIAQGTRLQPGQRDRLVAFHARQTQLPTDYGFNADQLAELRERFAADLDLLRRTVRAEIIGAPDMALAAE